MTETEPLPGQGAEGNLMNKSEEMTVGWSIYYDVHLR